MNFRNYSQTHDLTERPSTKTTRTTLKNLHWFPIDTNQAFPTSIQTPVQYTKGVDLGWTAYRLPSHGKVCQE